jgi:DNA-binding YbaB/EbfC family protein
MKLPGGFDLQEMMQQAKQMQEHLQREMQQVRVEASVGGGIVSVSMNGAKELVDLKIDPETVKNGDVEMLQDLIIAAVNEASRKADEAMKGKFTTWRDGTSRRPALAPSSHQKLANLIQPYKETPSRKAKLNLQLADGRANARLR